jgi:hypothetical protein
MFLPHLLQVLSITWLLLAVQAADITQAVVVLLVDTNLDHHFQLAEVLQ